MAYYDAVRSGMANARGLFRRLGFNGVMIEGEDFYFAGDSGSANGKVVAYYSKSTSLTPYLKNGARAVIPQTPEAMGEMRKYVKDMRDYGTSFVIDASVIENAYGTYRALLIGKLRDCTTIMLGKGIKVNIASLAKNPMEVLAPEQLMAICIAMGMDKSEARKALAVSRAIISKL